MNWVDSAVLGIVAISAALAFTRGFVRETLGLGAWVGAFFFASVTVDLVRPTVRGWIGNTDIADPVAYTAMFLIGLIVLSVITGIVGSFVRSSMLNGVDRTLGVVFGIVRALVLIAAAYIGSGFVVASDRWPDAVKEARSLPYVYNLANWVVRFLPPDYRPNVVPPPMGRQTNAADLLHATPQGRATARP
ncbi:CvpA family protein [Limobrevibacterium gyesilva]|uniref:CvpA family protein n=1 Tax=Limobrevibacterium gyesilva TaxID=2991712 RepID=A0AA41YRK1_9PROT|nr:CvpA family protein [Limobrevibacterium gyesilva]